MLGDPPPDAPALWLLGVLALSIGAPFAALSATAPLVQAWHARVFRDEDAREPYALYAASNLGSLLALLAYPVIVEPLITLQGPNLRLERRLRRFRGAAGPAGPGAMAARQGPGRPDKR